MKRINEDEIMNAIRDLQDEAYERFGSDVRIFIDTMISEGEALTVEVSWKSIGGQTPEDAEAFANKILEAVEMAQSFPYTGAVICHDGDDFWYEMEEEEDDDEEQEETEHMDDIMAEIATSRRPWQRDTISEEWNGNGFDRLIIDISYDPHIDENGSAWRYKIHPDYDLEDRFDGAGYAEALSEKLEQDYAAADGDKIATAIAMARISEICHDYEDIKAGRPSAPSKRQMADIWAEAMGLELIEDIQTGPWDEALWAEGYLAKYRILVMYNANFNGEEV